MNCDELIARHDLSPATECDLRIQLHVRVMSFQQRFGHQAIKSGFQVYCRSVFDMVRDFLKDERLSGPERVLNKYLRPDLVIIDDMEMKSLPPRSGEFLFEIVMRRHELRSTMMTSNRPVRSGTSGVGELECRNGRCWLLLR
jgi:chromosomal replication initiation ATPase DnaA